MEKKCIKDIETIDKIEMWALTCCIDIKSLKYNNCTVIM